MNPELALLMPIVLASATLTSTGIGGLAAFRFRERLHLLLGFGAGAVIAVALFDMLPEVVALGGRHTSNSPRLVSWPFLDWNVIRPCIALTTVLI
jgi:zinc transporter ZupT